MEKYPEFVLIHLFYRKCLGSLKHQPVFLFVCQKIFINENKKTFFVILFFFDKKKNISSPVRYSHLSIFSDSANIFAASLLRSYCSFSLLISFYILSRRFFLKGEGLSNKKIRLITKKEYDFAIHFL